MAWVFWLSVVGVLYPYLGYPLLLWALTASRGRRDERIGTADMPSVSMIVPVHNEEGAIERKIVNTAALTYPTDRLQVVFVSDGSTDGTVDIIRANATAAMELVELRERGGKAAALNAGLERAAHEILVFSDASIELESGAIEKIVEQFADPRIGCVSGEDRIADSGGEAWYGRYELWLRRLESQLQSIVGASGSFYAQRRALCARFSEGMAPDFLSVLRTVEQGYRAVSEPAAVGVMTSVKDPRREFDRKVRTFIRGMTTLFAHGGVLNPLRFGWFSFALWSHKLMRWTVPLFLLSTLASSLALWESGIYRAACVAQFVFYTLALAALLRVGGIQRTFLAKIALYFSTVNAAIVAAWFQYLRGVRQEVWAPSRR